MSLWTSRSRFFPEKTPSSVLPCNSCWPSLLLKTLSSGSALVFFFAFCTTCSLYLLLWCLRMVREFALCKEPDQEGVSFDSCVSKWGYWEHRNPLSHVSLWDSKCVLTQDRYQKASKGPEGRNHRVPGKPGDSDDRTHSNIGFPSICCNYH